MTGRNDQANLQAGDQLSGESQLSEVWAQEDRKTAQQAPG